MRALLTTSSRSKAKFPLVQPASAPAPPPPTTSGAAYANYDEQETIVPNYKTELAQMVKMG